jgi:hypothetical protein
MMTDQCDRPLASHHLRPQGQNDHDDNSNVIKGSHGIAASQCGRLAAGYQSSKGVRKRRTVTASAHRSGRARVDKIIAGLLVEAAYVAGQVIRDQRRFPLGDDSFL